MLRRGKCYCLNEMKNKGSEEENCYMNNVSEEEINPQKTKLLEKKIKMN